MRLCWHLAPCRCPPGFAAGFAMLRATAVFVQVWWVVCSHLFFAFSHVVAVLGRVGAEWCWD